MERHYGMDWLRIGAFALLIFYHIGMFFVPWGWHVKTAQPIDWVQLPMLATNAWRLPLLFVVSGYASAALLGRQAGLGRFAANRTARLMVPTLFAVIAIIPPQPWVELMVKHGYARSLGHFWTADYFRFGAIEGIVVPTWQHLWFVVYLWVYTILLVALLAVIPARARAGMSRVADTFLSGPGLLLVPLAWLVAHMAAHWPGAEETHALVDDLAAHQVYFPAFLFGFFLRGAPRSWEAIRRWWRLAAVLAILAYAVVGAIDAAWISGTVPATTLRLPFAVARLAQGWCAVIALIGLADRHWNRDHRLRPMLTEAVFPFYIIHQTIIVLLGWYLLRFALPAWAEFAILVPATAAGCWLFYRVGRGIPLVRLLIGLRPRVARARASA